MKTPKERAEHVMRAVSTFSYQRLSNELFMALPNIEASNGIELSLSKDLY